MSTATKSKSKTAKLAKSTPEQIESEIVRLTDETWARASLSHVGLMTCIESLNMLTAVKEVIEWGTDTGRDMTDLKKASHYLTTIMISRCG